MTATIAPRIRPVCKHADTDRDWENLMILASMNVDHVRRLAPNVPAPLPPVVIHRDDFCLKKLKVHADMSEETNAFSAEVWFRNKLVGYAKNDGRGGSTHIQNVARDSLVEVEAWASALPPESSYDRVYKSVEMGESVYAAESLESLQAEWWATTRSLDLESLVDSLVEAAASRKSIRDLKSYVIAGPHQDQPDEAPVLLKYKKEPTEAALAEAVYAWVVPLADVLDLPFHYYPSPHPFAGIGWPHQQVTAGGREGEVSHHGTNDHKVTVRFGTREAGEEVSFDPSEVAFLDA